MTPRLLPYVALLAMGAGWGLSQPLNKIAVSGGHQPLGLIFWQLVIASTVLGCLILLTGRRLPRGWRAWGMCATISLVGAVVPNTASYAALSHLPAGVMAIVLSMVPMFAFPVALAFGTDRFGMARLAGLVLGLVGVALIALPQGSLPQGGMVLFLPLALVAPVCYAFEANIVAKWGTGGLDPLQLLFGASLVGLVFALPAALISGQFIDPRPPWGAPDMALVAGAALSALVYASYVWMIGRTGSVFAAQVSYLVTGFGVLWSMAVLGESYSVWVWAAFVIMLAGMALVRPREAAPAEPACTVGALGQSCSDAG